MPRCFFTGVSMRMADAYVINRRAARLAIDGLRHQIQSLQRLLDQLGPLDAVPSPAVPANGSPRHSAAPLRHRLVCKGMAIVLAQGFPDIELFESWSDYRAHAHGQAAGKQATGGGDNEAARI